MTTRKQRHAASDLIIASRPGSRKPLVKRMRLVAAKLLPPKNLAAKPKRLTAKFLQKKKLAAKPKQLLKNAAWKVFISTSHAMIRKKIIGKDREPASSLQRALADPSMEYSAQLPTEQDDEVLMHGQSGIWPSSDNEEEEDSSFQDISESEEEDDDESSYNSYNSLSDLDDL